MGGVRQRLLGRKRPSITYDLVVDADSIGPARAALQAAQKVQRQAHLSTGKGRAAAIRKADQAVAAAQAEVDACYQRVTLWALRPHVEEQLRAAHPPTAEQMQAAAQARQEAAERGEPPPDWPIWNDTTYLPALLAACTPHTSKLAADGELCTVCLGPPVDVVHDPADGEEMTAADWLEFLASNVALGEREGLRRAVRDVNLKERIADPLVLPKEWMAMASSR